MCSIPSAGAGSIVAEQARAIELCWAAQAVMRNVLVSSQQMPRDCEAAAYQVQMLVVSPQIHAMMVVLCWVVQAVVSAWAGNDDVWGFPCQEAVEELAVIVLQYAMHTHEHSYTGTL